MRGLLLIPALLAAALVYAAFDSDSGLAAWWRLRTDLTESSGRIGDVRREIAVLEAEAAALENDPFAVERAIREDLDLARAGETIVRLSAGEGSNPRFP